MYSMSGSVGGVIAPYERKSYLRLHVVPVLFKYSNTSQQTTRNSTVNVSHYTCVVQVPCKHPHVSSFSQWHKL